MIIISDIHLGTQRQAGTTPASQLALKQYIREEFTSLVVGEKGLEAAKAGKTLTVNGDLFDGFYVDPREVIVAYEVLSSYIINGGLVDLGMGNHDASAKGDKTSSFHLLAHMLESRFPQQVKVIDHTCGLTQIEGSVWMIPHMLNQELFNIEIEKAIKVGEGKEGYLSIPDLKPIGNYLLLHCNILSPFAEHSDHSLNLDQGQIDALIGAGWQLVVGHEHPGKSYAGGKVVLPGNQIPTSISDCLGNKDMAKSYAEITDAGLKLHKWLDLTPVFTDVDWRQIDEKDLSSFQFIRVSGDCTSNEAADMVGAVSKLRQGSSAFVVANAVKVEGIAQMEGLAEMSMEGLSKFDVLGALLEELDEREQKAVRSLMGVAEPAPAVKVEQ